MKKWQGTNTIGLSSHSKQTLHPITTFWTTFVFAAFLVDFVDYLRDRPSHEAVTQRVARGTAIDMLAGGSGNEQ
jgi:hypothetical protein